MKLRSLREIVNEVYRLHSGNRRPDQGGTVVEVPINKKTTEQQYCPSFLTITSRDMPLFLVTLASFLKNVVRHDFASRNGVDFNYGASGVEVPGSGVLSASPAVSVVAGGVVVAGFLSFLPQPSEKHARQATIRVSAINFFIFISPYVLHM